MISFEDWCKQKYEEAPDDLDVMAIWAAKRVVDGTWHGGYAQMCDQLWDAENSRYDHNRYLQEGLDKLFIKYAYEVKL